MVLIPTYYSFGFDGGSSGTGNRLNAISAKIAVEFPQYTISSARRINRRRARGGRGNLDTQQPARFVLDVQKPSRGPGFADRPDSQFGVGVDPSSGFGSGSVAPGRPPISSGPNFGFGSDGSSVAPGRPGTGRPKPKPSTVDTIIFERPDKPNLAGPRNPDSRPKPDDDTGIDVTIGPGSGIGGRPIDGRPNPDVDNGFGLGFGPNSDTNISIDGRPIEDDGPSIGIGPRDPGTQVPGRPGIGPDIGVGPDIPNPGTGVDGRPGIGPGFGVGPDVPNPGTGVDGRPTSGPNFGYGPGVIQPPGGRPAPDRPIPPNEKPDLDSGLGVVTIIDDPAEDPRPGRGNVGIDSGANSETGENSPTGTIQTQFGFVFPSKYRVNVLEQLPSWLRDRNRNV